MNLEHEFDIAFKDQGGLYPTNLFGTDLTYCLEKMRSMIASVNEDTRINIYVNLVANEGLNAAVRKVNNFYFIGVYFGGMYVLWDLFQRMLSNPNVLTKCGNPSNEVARKLYDARIKDVGTLYLATTNDERLVPFDTVRYNAAVMLLNFTLNNLMLHEFAHIVLGHCDYKNSKFNQGYFLKNEGNSALSLSPVFQQCLELEADSFATNLAIYFHLNNSIKVGEAENAFLLLKEEIHKKILLWNFSIYSFWLLFDSSDINLDNLKETSHPFPGLRERVICEVARAIIKLNVPDSDIREKTLDNLDSALLIAENAFSQISVQDLTFNSYELARSQKAINHFYFLKEYTKNIVIPALKDFRQIDLEMK